MGSTGRAASKKSSRNQGLRPVSAILLPCSGRTIHCRRRLCGTCRRSQPTCGKREILGNSGLSPHHRAAKTASRPLQPVPPRRVIAAADRLDNPAQQPRLLVPPQANKGRPIDRDLARRTRPRGPRPPPRRALARGRGGRYRRQARSADGRRAASPARSADRRWKDRRSTARRERPASR